MVPNMRKKFWSSQRIPDEEIQALWRRRQAGEPIKALAEERGTTTECVTALFKSRGLSTLITKRCELPECGKEFQTPQDSQRCCCKKHVKAVGAREAKGLTVSDIPCAIPECCNTVHVVHSGRKPAFTGKGGRDKKFCSEAHADLMGNRRKGGVYQRLLGKKHVCFVNSCKEWLVLDEHHERHHERHHKGKSDKTSKTYWLCPTHHQMIHRGYATLENGVFTSLVPAILRGIESKSKMFVGYKTYCLSKPRSRT